MTSKQFKEASLKIINFYLENGLSEKDIEGIVWGMVATYNSKFGGLNLSCKGGIKKVNSNGSVGGKINIQNIFD